MSCSGSATNIERVDGGAFELYSTSAGSSLSVASKKSERVCVRLGPDALYDQHEEFGIHVFNIEEADDGAGVDEGELIGRTPVVVAFRDAAYNLCIANINGALPDKVYVQMLQSLYKRGFDALEKEVETYSVKFANHRIVEANVTERPQPTKAVAKAKAATAVEPKKTQCHGPSCKK